MAAGHDAPEPVMWRGRKTLHCHLVADSLEELHQVAAQIGLQRDWFQEGSGPHYDVLSQRLVTATRRLVPLVTREEMLLMVERCRGTPRVPKRRNYAVPEKPKAGLFEEEP